MSDSLYDSLVRRQTWMQNYSAAIHGDFDVYLAQVDRIIKSILIDYDEIRTQEDVADISRMIDEQIKPIFLTWADSFLSELQDGVEDQQEFTQEAIEAEESEFEFDWGLAMELSPLLLGVMPLNQSGTKTIRLMAAINGTPREWISELKDQVRRAYQNGTPASELMSIIRGNVRNGRRGSVLGDIDRSAEGLIRTVVNSVVNQVNMEVAARSKVFTAWQYISILDGRTTAFCREHHAKIYPIGVGPIPPNHWRCRSMALPFTGQPFTTDSYYDWLARQPRKFQDSVLGPTKGRLFRSGGIDKDDFGKILINAYGRPRTLAEIKRLRPLAWERADLDN